MKKYLIIETFPNSPHIEASIEIAINLRKKNNKVYFFWCGYDLPWTDWKLSLSKKILSFSFENKIKRLESYLISKNVEVIPRFNLNTSHYQCINNAISSFNNFKKLKYFEYKKVQVGLAVYSSLVTKSHNLDICSFKDKIKPALMSSCIVFERSNKVIKEINPHTVITFNCRFAISKPIISSAKFNKKKILIHERGSTLNKYEIFTDDVHDNDYIYKKCFLHWENNKDLKKKTTIAKKYFRLVENKKFIAKVGLDFEKKTESKINFDKNKKIITYLCSTDYECVAVYLDVNKYYINEYWSDQINTLKSIINIIKKDPNIILYIKSHPNFSPRNNQEEKLKELETNNVVYLSVDDRQDTYELIRNSDLIISFGTSLELYAVYLNKKVISFVKTFYTNFNFIFYPKNENTLKKLIYEKEKINYNNIKKLNLLKVAYYIMTFGIDYKFYKAINYSRGYFKGTRIDHYGFFSPLMNFIYRRIK
jgi:hypothetical protein